MGDEMVKRFCLALLTAITLSAPVAPCNIETTDPLWDIEAAGQYHIVDNGGCLGDPEPTCCTNANFCLYRGVLRNLGTFCEDGRERVKHLYELCQLTETINGQTFCVVQVYTNDLLMAVWQ
jgi:hypothetical protein